MFSFCRLDQILGKPGADRRKGRGSNDIELYDPSVSLLSRVVKVERRVTLIDRKLDMLIEMYREERHAKNASSECRSDERDDSHESELETAPKGFANRRRNHSSPMPTRAAHRSESTESSSATSPADSTIPKLSTSQPRLGQANPLYTTINTEDTKDSVFAAGNKDSSISPSVSNPELVQQQQQPDLVTTINDSMPVIQKVVDTVMSSLQPVPVITGGNDNTEEQPAENTGSRTEKNPMRSALRRKRPLSGSRSLRGTNSTGTDKTDAGLTPSGESGVSFGSSSSLQNPDTETRI